jgi:hypothetical protein
MPPATPLKDLATTLIGGMIIFAGISLVAYSLEFLSSHLITTEIGTFTTTVLFWAGRLLFLVSFIYLAALLLGAVLNLRDSIRGKSGK